MKKRIIGGVLAVAVVLGLVIAPGVAPKASALSGVGCSPAGSGHYTCNWWPGGNGYSGGTPVMAKPTMWSKRVGYLPHGKNWVLCQTQYGETASGPNHTYNGHWALTVAENGVRGWAPAVDAVGGGYGGSFVNVPYCRDGAS